MGNIATQADTIRLYNCLGNKEPVHKGIENTRCWGPRTQSS
jgi:hypothetical protein